MHLIRTEKQKVTLVTVSTRRGGIEIVVPTTVILSPKESKKLRRQLKEAERAAANNGFNDPF